MIRAKLTKAKWIGIGAGAVALAACGAVAQNSETDRSKLPTPSGLVADAPKIDWV